MAKSIKREWTDEERLSALKIYCELKFSELNRANPSVIELSKKINRTPSAVGMKLCNFAHLDPDVEQKGLPFVSKADRLLMARFVSDRDSVIAESKKAFEKLEKKFSNALEYTPPDSIDKKTEQTAEIKIRTLQGKFREMILALYGQKCAICSLDIPELLVASHIVPWAEDESIRLDPTNGICLCNLHDKAFDRGFISISNDYNLMMGSEINAKKAMPLIQNYFLSYDAVKINLPKDYPPDKGALGYHRKNIFKA